MNLLLDTHAFLWFISGVERFSLSTKSTIADPSNRVFLSVASVWEIAIKCSLGKLELEGSFENFIMAWSPIPMTCSKEVNHGIARTPQCSSAPS